MEKTVRLRTDVAGLIVFFFVGLMVFSTIDQYASRSILVGNDVPWYNTFKKWYNSYILSMVIVFAIAAVIIIIKQKNYEIETLKTDIMKMLVYVKKLVKLPDKEFKMEPKSAIECKVSKKMIDVIQNTRAFKEIETKVSATGFSDIASQTNLFSEQILTKYKPDVVLSDLSKVEKLDFELKEIIAKPGKYDITLGIPDATNLVKQFLSDLNVRVMKLSKYRLYYIKLKEPVLLEKNEDIDLYTTEEYEERLEENGIKSILLLTPGEFYQVLKFTTTERYDPDTGMVSSARIAHGSMKLIRYALPKLPMFVLNDCSLTSDAFWEITFNNNVLSDSTTVALSFLSYFAIDEAEDLRKELEKTRVDLVKAETLIDAKKDSLIEELILNGDLKRIWKKDIKKEVSNSAKKSTWKSTLSLIAGIIMLILIIIILAKVF